MSNIKIIILLLLGILPYTFYAQIQINQDIDGEFKGDNFGYNVSISSNGKIVAIGAPRNSDNGYQSGHVKVYKNHNSNWEQIGQNISGQAERDFSGSCTSLSSDGNILAISSKYHTENGIKLGQVRIFKNKENNWIQIGEDIIGEVEKGSFGESISLSSNGNIIAIGTPFSNGNGQSSGHVSIFKNKKNTWVQIGENINGEASRNTFGENVSLSSDGKIIAVGAPSNNGNGQNSGHVRVFKNIKDNWVQMGQDIDGEAINDQSGSSISLSSNGKVVAIGARGNDGNGGQSGHVRIFKYENNFWVQIGQDIDGEMSASFSGESISLSSNGDIVAIGVQNNDGNGFRSGHVRVFRNKNDSWVQMGKDIDGEDELNYSGFSVSLSSNGNIVAIGAHRNDGNGKSSGHVRVYDLTKRQ